MGMFDSIFGYVNCPKCEKEVSCDIQFKWGPCLLLNYELGDYVLDAPEKGYKIEYCNIGTHCEYCGTHIVPYAIIRNGKLIAILNQVEIENINLDDLPDVEDHYAKNQRYREDVENGVGITKEQEDFNEHPKKVGDFITALEREWEIKEVYRKEIDETSRYGLFKKLRGSLGRLSDVWYVYKVYNKDIGERWIEISHRIPTLYARMSLREGNMELFKDYDLDEKGYKIINL